MNVLRAKRIFYLLHPVCVIYILFDFHYYYFNRAFTGVTFSVTHLYRVGVKPARLLF